MCNASAVVLASSRNNVGKAIDVCFFVQTTKQYTCVNALNCLKQCQAIVHYSNKQLPA